MSSQGDRFWEVVPYGNYRDLTHAPMLMQCFFFFSCIVNFEKKNQTPGAPVEKFPFLVLDRNTTASKHLIIHFLLYYLSIGRLREVKKKEKFQAFSFTELSVSLTRGCRLQEIQNLVI